MSVPEMSEEDRRLLHRAALRNKYSHLAGDLRYGRCYSDTCCKTFIRPWHRVAIWNGHYWHADCLSDAVFERMSTLTDNPAIAALLDEYCPPITYRRWDLNMATHYEVASSLIDPEKNEDMAPSNLTRRINETALVAQVHATLSLVDVLEKLHASYVESRDTTFRQKDSSR